MNRCKLISPTNLMLERPMLSPVEEVEFFVIGTKEYSRLQRQSVAAGFLVGGFFFLCVVVLIKMWRGAL